MTLLANTEFRELAIDLMASMLVKQIKQEQRDDIWLAFVQAVAGVERRYIAALRRFFIDQMIAVLRRMPLITFASYRAVTKALVENWLFPTEEWIEPLVTLGGIYSLEALEISGSNAMDNLVLGANFQADTPEVFQALAQRNLRLSGVVNSESIERLRETLTEGLMEGEGIPKLRKRVIELYGDFSRSRADMIARTEVIWASNEGVEQAWIQSRVVEGKEWLTAEDDRVDPICIEMEGKTAPLGDNFFDLGDSLTVTGANDREITAHFDFEEIRHPPIHPRCRCTLIPIVVEIAGIRYNREERIQDLTFEGTREIDMSGLVRSGGREFNEFSFKKSKIFVETGLDEEIAKQAADALASIPEEHMMRRFRIRPDGTRKRAKRVEIFCYKDSTGAGGFGQADYLEGQIHIFKVDSSFQKIEGTVLHEMGHMSSHTYSSFDTAEDWLPKGFVNELKADGKNITGYGTLDKTDEAFSEAYAKFYGNGFVNAEDNGERLEKVTEWFQNADNFGAGNPSGKREWLLNP